jgi:hypothetical protein
MITLTQTYTEAGILPNTVFPVRVVSAFGSSKVSGHRALEQALSKLEKNNVDITHVFNLKLETASIGSESEYKFCVNVVGDGYTKWGM